MSKLRTLVVDDHMDFLRLAKALLEELDDVDLIGFGQDGTEAVALCDQLQPDLLLMDLSMPKMGGIQATRLIRAQNKPPTIAIVSIYDDPEHREHAARAGADAFISKADFLGSVVTLVEQLSGGRDVRVAHTGY